MNTEELLNILTYYHLQYFSSGRELIQTLQEDDYARQFVAPEGGIKRSTFFDTVNDSGAEQYCLCSKPHLCLSHISLSCKELVFISLKIPVW
jgi:hypothetical protein